MGYLGLQHFLCKDETVFNQIAKYVSILILNNRIFSTYATEEAFFRAIKPTCLYKVKAINLGEKNEKSSCEK